MNGVWVIRLYLWALKNCWPIPTSLFFVETYVKKEVEGEHWNLKTTNCHTLWIKPYFVPLGKCPSGACSGMNFGINLYLFANNFMISKSLPTIGLKLINGIVPMKDTFICFPNGICKCLGHSPLTNCVFDLPNTGHMEKWTLSSAESKLKEKILPKSKF